MKASFLKTAGFTLLEMLLTVALIAVIAGFSVPVYQSFQSRNDLGTAATTFVQTARRAQLLAQAVDGDQTWGVRVGSGAITLFRGTSYAARDTDFDEIFSLPTVIGASGITEVVFAKLTGLPNTSGTLTFTSSSLNAAQSITLTAKGALMY